MKSIKATETLSSAEKIVGTTTMNKVRWSAKKLQPSDNKVTKRENTLVGNDQQKNKAKKEKRPKIPKIYVQDKCTNTEQTVNMKAKGTITDIQLSHKPVKNSSNEDEDAWFKHVVSMIEFSKEEGA